MGEIADGLINGDFDFHTGEYLGKGSGIPRTKNKSLAWEKKDYTFSKDVAFKGIKKYLKNRLKVNDIAATVDEYIPSDSMTLKQKCVAIQTKWGDFVNWVNKRYGYPDKIPPKK